MGSRIRRAFHTLRTEGAGGGRDAAAIGLGIFIGCLPLFGFHLFLCWTTGWALRLNRLKMYFAAHVSNPLFAPALLFAEIQIGAWLRRGALHPLTIDTVRTAGLSTLGGDVIAGSLAVGSVLGIAMAAATYALSHESRGDTEFLAIVRDASDRYVRTSITAWEFARGKLRSDPIYRAIVCDRLLPSGGTLVDVGCGQGLALAILAEGARRFRRGAWPHHWGRPPQFDRAIGVEMRTRAAQLARRALDADADIVTDDARRLPLPRCRAALILDVLHMIPGHEQDTVIALVTAALEEGGVILVREADAGAGGRFAAVRLGNRLKALALGTWRQRFYFRTTDEWLECFAEAGLAAEVLPMSSGPFANVLFRLTKTSRV